MFSVRLRKEVGLAMRSKTIALCVLAVLGSSLSQASANVSLTGVGSGWVSQNLPTNGVWVWEARARAENSGYEIVSGLDAGGPSATKQVADFDYATGAEYDFQLSYNNGTLTFTLDNTSVSYSGLAPATDLFLQFRLNSPGIDAALTNLWLDNQSLGTWSVTNQTGTTTFWARYSGLSNPFTLSGGLRGAFDQPISEKLSVSFIGVSVIPAPGAALLAFFGLGIVGWVKRRFA